MLFKLFDGNKIDVCKDSSFKIRSFVLKNDKLIAETFAEDKIDHICNIHPTLNYFGIDGDYFERKTNNYEDIRHVVYRLFMIYKKDTIVKVKFLTKIRKIANQIKCGKMNVNAFLPKNIC